MSIESDLRNHLNKDPRNAHGIWNMIQALFPRPARGKFRVYLSADQSNLTINTYTKVAFDTASYNIGSNFNLTSNRFVAPEACFVLFTSSLQLAGVGASHLHNLAYYKNGSIVSSMVAASNAEADGISPALVDILQLAKDDYIEVFARSVNNATTDILSGATASFFAGHILSI